MTFDMIMKEIQSICEAHRVEHLYLFGSYATNDETPTSDVDIIIKGGDRIPALKEEIDKIKTLTKIDVFEYDKCRNPFLIEDMDKYGRQIY